MGQEGACVVVRVALKAEGQLAGVALVIKGGPLPHKASLYRSLPGPSWHSLALHRSTHTLVDSALGLWAQSLSDTATARPA